MKETKATGTKEIMNKKYTSEQLKNSKGVRLYNSAKKIIPGGTQLLSKRPEMFAPDYWPAITKEQKAQKYGILMIENFLICQ